MRFATHALLAFAIALGATTSCAAPSEAQVAHAEAVVARAEAGDPSVTPEEEQVARAVLAAHQGFDWTELSVAVICALLGTPFLGPRGWRVASGALSSIRGGRFGPAVRAIPALVGAASSQPIIAQGEESRRERAKPKAVRYEPRGKERRD